MGGRRTGFTDFSLPAFAHISDFYLKFLSTLSIRGSWAVQGPDGAGAGAGAEFQSWFPDQCSSTARRPLQEDAKALSWPVKWG